MSEYVSTIALILKAQDYKECDQLLTVYTKAKGKMRVLAKGVKKNSSKLRGGLQLFGQSALTLTIGQGIPVVINAESMNIFPAIRDDLLRLSYAGYCMDLLDRLIVSDEYDEAIFGLILQAMNLLAYINPWMATKMLEIHLLDALGYAPDVVHCHICGRMLRPGEKRLGTVGGACCPPCRKQSLKEPAVTLEAEAVTLYQALRHLPAVQLGYLYASNQAMRQLERYVDLQLDHILEYPLKTRDFLRTMAKV